MNFILTCPGICRSIHRELPGRDHLRSLWKESHHVVHESGTRTGQSYLISHKHIVEIAGCGHRDGRPAMAALASGQDRHGSGSGIGPTIDAYREPPFSREGLVLSPCKTLITIVHLRDRACSNPRHTALQLRMGLLHWPTPLVRRTTGRQQDGPEQLPKSHLFRMGTPWTLDYPVGVHARKPVVLCSKRSIGQSCQNPQPDLQGCRGVRRREGVCCHDSRDRA